ncbi:hypothetical protein R1sor_012097 [Riccia sorocarpa]|uniref:NB-ARC domain-containing protein n=1 Tax=Riccia sorocarpa TaxID=122646 RepID=A0ABD3I705_9MARC
MGGVGKSTLAKLVFNKVFAKFEYTCFIEEIKRIPRTKEEAKSLVWEKMRHHGIPVSSASGSSGRSGWHQVMGKSLLVVFDDVDDSDHVTLLEEIAYENGMEESRFLLTSRNAERLRNVKTIRLDALGREDATKLFTLYAFPGQPDPPGLFSRVLEEVVDGCEGLPLTLEVLGRYLKGQRIEFWKEIPGALRECDEEIADLEEKVWAKLQLSYDGLPGREVKNMFLDIVSVFMPDNPSYRTSFSAADVKIAWSSTDKVVFNRLQILKDRALVTVRGEEEVTFDSGCDYTEFYMHEHLRRMGQRIVRREGRSFNLYTSWKYPFDVPDVFGGLQKLKSFTLVCRAVENSLVGSLGRLSALEELYLACETLQQLPDVFGCSSTLKTLWIGCPSLQRLPDTFGEFSQLTTLHINDTGLRFLPDSFARISQLKELHIAGCDYLSALPDSLSALPDSLNDVLGGCEYLIQLPDEFTARIMNTWWPVKSLVGRWSRSQYLESKPWDTLRLLPEPICQLSRLEYLSLRHLQFLRWLPEALGDLHSLRELEIFMCAMKSLPESLGRLSSLTNLGVTYCENVKTLPGTIGDLSSLTCLDLSGSAILSLPGIFSNLSQLKELRIIECKNLKLPADMGGTRIIEERY